MAQPTPYDRLYNFTDWQTVNPTKPLPATELDAELNALELTTDQIRANLALIQRDDGKLANQAVTPESLSAGTLALINQGEYNPRGDWVTATAYAVGDVVDYNLATYLCLTAHTSAIAFPTDLSAGRWLLIANGALSGEAQAVDLFEGTGAQTVFTLSVNYQGSNAAAVFVGGVAQIPVQDFTIAGTTLTFVVAPAAPSIPGNKNVMVRGTAVSVQLASDVAIQAAADAQGFANAADASATAAGLSEVAAAASQVAASGSAAAALLSESNAEASETAAAASASTATTQAGIATTGANTATTQAGIATTAANTATTQAGIATTGANTATTQAGIATTQASAASSSASAALASEQAAAASFDSFDDRYLGAKASDPALDNDGNALLTGALYWNTSVPEMRVYTGSAWIVAYNPSTAINATAPSSITVNSASNALSITQTGSGNALYIEDVAADATPLVVSSTGVLGIGTTTPDNVTSAGIALVSNDGFMPQLVNRNKTADANASYQVFDKDRAGAIVQNGDVLGNIVFRGFDGTDYDQSVAIMAAVDGTPGNNDMPGRLMFLTTADGASAPTERLRITSAGNVEFQNGYTEKIFAITGTTPALSPTNGSIQTWTLTGASTPTQGTWANGQSMTLLIDDGTANTINWGTLGVVWKTNGGSAPTLLTTGLTVIQLWEVGNVIYGARVGDA